MISVSKAEKATLELLVGLNRLLPQLTSNARTLEMNDLEALVNSPATSLFVASDGSVIVGTLTLIIVPIPTGLRAWIEDVVVDEAQRGRGVGEALTGSAIEEAKSHHVRSLDLTSRPTRSAANALYQKMGFESRETNVYRFFIEN